MRRRSIPGRGFRGRLWPERLAPFRHHPALAGVSSWYSGLRGRLPTCYSPVRHWSIAAPVRLACIRHAAGVYPEPGSNSLWISRAGLAADVLDSSVMFLPLCASAPGIGSERNPVFTVQHLNISRILTFSLYVCTGHPVQFSKSNRMRFSWGAVRILPCRGLNCQ